MTARAAGAERARHEGAAIAREILAGVRRMVQGVQVGPPLGRYEQVLDVLQAR